MSEKANKFIEGLDWLISDSVAVRGKTDKFQLSDEGGGRLLVIEKKKAGIPSGDVYKSELTAIPRRLLASALGDIGAVHLQAYQGRGRGYLEIAAAVSRLGLEAIADPYPLRVETVLARGFDGKGIEGTLAIAVSGLLRERPIEQHEDDALALLSLAQDFIRRI